MQLIFFLCLFSSFHAATETHPSNGKQIHQVIFQNDKLFYISRLNREFGIMLIDNRVVVSQYRLAEEQSILKVDEHLKKLILRKGRDKVLVFKLKTLDIAEVQIEIAFNHQKIIDFIQIEDKIFVSTEKDVRIYSKTDQMKQDHPKNIITSGRKRQVFRKIFLNTIDGQQHLSLIFSRDQQICLRKVFHNKTQTQSCLFNVSSQLQEIQRMGSNYLIQTATLNYVIKQDQTFYSFKGFITQIDDRFAVMSSQFKTFDILRQTSLEGIAVIGSQVNQTFWIRHKQKALVLYFKDIAILTLNNQTIKRSWVSKDSAKGVYNFLLQFQDNGLTLYQIDPQSWKAVIKWSDYETRENLDQEL